MTSTLKRTTWNLRDAKARLSELVDGAQAGTPQIILRRGEPVAALVSLSEYATLRPRKSLVRFLLESPLRGSGVKIN